MTLESFDCGLVSQQYKIRLRIEAGVGRAFPIRRVPRSRLELPKPPPPSPQATNKVNQVEFNLQKQLTPNFQKPNASDY